MQCAPVIRGIDRPSLWTYTRAPRSGYIGSPVSSTAPSPVQLTIVSARWVSRICCSRSVLDPGPYDPAAGRGDLLHQPGQVGVGVDHRGEVGVGVADAGGGVHSVLLRQPGVVPEALYVLAQFEHLAVLDRVVLHGAAEVEDRRPEVDAGAAVLGQSAEPFVGGQAP